MTRVSKGHLDAAVMLHKVYCVRDCERSPYKWLDNLDSLVALYGPKVVEHINAYDGPFFNQPLFGGPFEKHLEGTPR